MSVLEVKRVTNKKELDDAFYIRKAVFVEEQGIPLDDEFDEHDSTCDHIVIYYQNEPAATGRLRIVNHDGKLERICVLKSKRTLGFGKVIVEHLEELAKDKGVSKEKLHGQTQAKGFYEKLGYYVDSDEFMEDGIPHFLMRKNLAD